MGWRILNPEESKIMEEFHVVKSDVNDLKNHRHECDDRHRRHEDKIDTIMNTLTRICTNTEAMARGDAAREIVKESIYTMSKLLGAIAVIFAALWHGFEYLIKLTQVIG